MIFDRLLTFQNQFLKKKYSRIQSKWQTSWFKIGPDALSGLIWVQSVWKGYQQTTQVHVGKA